ncbi:MAG: M24 family metallopeptidase [Alphaproteobacteria bacterium]|nr:M24 family metallopeptidase [Alphaproteobacteria bacterium]
MNTADVTILYQKSGKYPYVSERNETCDILKALTGLSASAGAVVISPKRSAVFVDGRYKLVAKLSVDLRKFDICNYNLAEITEWIKNNISFGTKISYDPRFFSIKSFKTILENLAEYNFIASDLEKELCLEPHRRELKIHKIKRIIHEQKILYISDLIKANNLDAYLLCDPCSISWLLNIRDFNTPFSPVVFGYLLVEKNLNLTFYLDELYSTIVNPSECNVKIKYEKDLSADLEKFSNIGVDEFETSAYIQHNNFQHISNPCISPKAIKNKIEINDIRNIAEMDSAAIINLLHWLYRNNSNTKLTEIEVAEKLIYFRKCYKEYISDSFPCISAADENSAIIHYSPTKQSNAQIKNILLLDTGGQYTYGTTDITRTICLNIPTNEQKLFYTQVLKGHIAFACMKFPAGTTLAQLEPFARQFLWRNSADYPHSTSHGIGYMSCVHEYLSANRKGNNSYLHSGMVISNEPGYYKDGEFGIRLENMMLIKDNSDDNFLEFETLSLVPFDWRMIDKNLLTSEELNWMDNYHKEICEKLKRYLADNVMNWLKTYLTVN